MEGASEIQTDNPTATFVENQQANISENGSKRSPENRPERNHVCSTCKKNYKTKETLKLHKRSVHGPKVQCGKCGIYCCYAYINAHKRICSKKVPRKQSNVQKGSLLENDVQPRSRHQSETQTGSLSQFGAQTGSRVQSVGQTGSQVQVGIYPSINHQRGKSATIIPNEHTVSNQESEIQDFVSSAQLNKPDSLLQCTGAVDTAVSIVNDRHEQIYAVPFTMRIDPSTSAPISMQIIPTLAIPLSEPDPMSQPPAVQQQCVSDVTVAYQAGSEPVYSQGENTTDERVLVGADVPLSEQVTKVPCSENPENRGAKGYQERTTIVQDRPVNSSIQSSEGEQSSVCNTVVLGDAEDVNSKAKVVRDTTGDSITSFDGYDGNVFGKVTEESVCDMIVGADEEDIHCMSSYYNEEGEDTDVSLRDTNSSILQVSSVEMTPVYPLREKADASNIEGTSGTLAQRTSNNLSIVEGLSVNGKTKTTHTPVKMRQPVSQTMCDDESLQVTKIKGSSSPGPYLDRDKTIMSEYYDLEEENSVDLYPDNIPDRMSTHDVQKLYHMSKQNRVPPQDKKEQRKPIADDNCAENMRRDKVPCSSVSEQKQSYISHPGRTDVESNKDIRLVASDVDRAKRNSSSHSLIEGPETWTAPPAFILPCQDVPHYESTIWEENDNPYHHFCSGRLHNMFAGITDRSNEFGPPFSWAGNTEWPMVSRKLPLYFPDEFLYGKEALGDRHPGSVEEHRYILNERRPAGSQHQLCRQCEVQPYADTVWNIVERQGSRLHPPECHSQPEGNVASEIQKDTHATELFVDSSPASNSEQCRLWTPYALDANSSCPTQNQKRQIDCTANDKRSELATFHRSYEALVGRDPHMTQDKVLLASSPSTASFNSSAECRLRQNESLPHSEIRRLLSSGQAGNRSFPHSHVDVVPPYCARIAEVSQSSTDLAILSNETRANMVLSALNSCQDVQSKENIPPSSTGKHPINNSFASPIPLRRYCGVTKPSRNTCGVFENVENCDRRLISDNGLSPRGSVNGNTTSIIQSLSNMVHRINTHQNPITSDRFRQVSPCLSTAGAFIQDSWTSDHIEEAALEPSKSSDEIRHVENAETSNPPSAEEEDASISKTLETQTSVSINDTARLENFRSSHNPIQDKNLKLNSKPIIKFSWPKKDERKVNKELVDVIEDSKQPQQVNEKSVIFPATEKNSQRNVEEEAGEGGQIVEKFKQNKQPSDQIMDAVGDSNDGILEEETVTENGQHVCAFRSNISCSSIHVSCVLNQEKRKMDEHNVVLDDEENSYEGTESGSPPYTYVYQDFVSKGEEEINEYNAESDDCSRNEGPSVNVETDRDQTYAEERNIKSRGRIGDRKLDKSMPNGANSVINEDVNISAESNESTSDWEVQDKDGNTSIEVPENVDNGKENRNIWSRLASEYPSIVSTSADTMMEKIKTKTSDGLIKGGQNDSVDNMLRTENCDETQDVIKVDVETSESVAESPLKGKRNIVCQAPLASNKSQENMYKAHHAEYPRNDAIRLEKYGSVCQAIENRKNLDSGDRNPQDVGMHITTIEHYNCCTRDSSTTELERMEVFRDYLQTYSDPAYNFHCFAKKKCVENKTEGTEVCVNSTGLNSGSVQRKVEENERQSNRLLCRAPASHNDSGKLEGAVHRKRHESQDRMSVSSSEGSVENRDCIAVIDIRGSSEEAKECVFAKAKEIEERSNKIRKGLAVNDKDFHTCSQKKKCGVVKENAIKDCVAGMPRGKDSLYQEHATDELSNLTSNTEEILGISSVFDRSIERPRKEDVSRTKRSTVQHWTGKLQSFNEHRDSVRSTMFREWKVISEMDKDHNHNMVNPKEAPSSTQENTITAANETISTSKYVTAETFCSIKNNRVKGKRKGTLANVLPTLTELITRKQTKIAKYVHTGQATENQQMSVSRDGK